MIAGWDFYFLKVLLTSREKKVLLAKEREKLT